VARRHRDRDPLPAARRVDEEIVDRREMRRQPPGAVTRPDCEQRRRRQP
jgi:hypothetical protein